jgi:hypothetical protein
MLCLPMIDWQELLKGKLPAVHGIHVGGPIKAIPRDRLTATEAEEAEQWRRAGGPSFIDKCCFVIKNRRVVKILVRSTLLDGIPIGEQADIMRLFGEPFGIERIFQWRLIHHYPQRRLSIAWNPREGRVEQVAFGPVTWEPRMFSARDLLDEWLAYRLGPTPEEPSDRSSSVGVRLIRVNALLRGFQLGSSTEFATGEFLLGKKPVSYPRACNAIRRRDSTFSAANCESQQWALRHVFSRLLHYRETAHQLLNFNSGILEAGLPGTLAPISITEGTNRRIATELVGIDRLLIALIDPDDLRIAEPDLEGWIYDDELKHLLEVEEWGRE